jgi:hypothetical protein
LDNVDELAPEEEERLDEGLRNRPKEYSPVIQEYSLPNIPNPEPADGKVYPTLTSLI